MESLCALLRQGIFSDSGDIMKDKRKMNEQHFLIDAACNNEKGIAYNEEINTLIVAILSLIHI